MNMTKSSRIGADLTEGSVFQGLLKFVVPIVLANLIQQLYSLVDLIVIGQYMGSVGTVGVSTGGELADMITPVAQAFGSAGQIYVAQLIGAREHEKLKQSIGTILSFMTLLAIVIMAIVIGARVWILKLLNCPAEAFSQADNYMVITALGFPFIMGYNAVTGILRGMGESKRPMLFICIAAITNVFLDILFVGPLHMEAAGAAIATTASEIASCIASLIYMYQRRDHFNFEIKLSNFKIRKNVFLVLLNLGLPQAIRSLLVRFSMLYVNASVNSYGLVESATNSVGNKLQKFLEVYTTSFSQAASAMVAQNLGARKYRRASAIILYSFSCCMVLASITAFLILKYPTQIFRVFTTDTAVSDMGIIYLKILVLHLFLSALTSTFQAMVIGSGFASLNFVIGILDGVVCKVGFGILLARVLNMGVYGFWWGTSISRLIPGIVVVVYFIRGKWKTRKLLSEY